MIEIVGENQIIEITREPIIIEIEQVNNPIELTTGGIYNFSFAGFNNYEILTATSGQNAFQLSKAPITPHQSIMFINGQKMAFVSDYMIDGLVLTWLNSFELSESDYIDIYYN